MSERSEVRADRAGRGRECRAEGLVGGWLKMGLKRPGPGPRHYNKSRTPIRPHPGLDPLEHPKKNSRSGSFCRSANSHSKNLERNFMLRKLMIIYVELES